MKTPETFWKWTAHISLAAVVLWLILELAGIIHTPLLIEYGVPFGGLVIGIFGFYNDVRKEVRNDVKDFRDELLARIDSVGNNVIEMKQDLVEVKAKVFHIDRDIERLKALVKAI